MSNPASFKVGDRVIARVTLDYPSGYAWGADDPTAVRIPAEIYAIEGDYGITWGCVKLSADRDLERFPAEYAHIPLDRLETASSKRVVAVGRVEDGRVMYGSIAADFGGDSAAAEALAHYGVMLEEARKDPRRSVYGADVALHDVMDFEHVIAVYPDGTVTDAPASLYAPECYWNGFGDGQHIESGAGWELLDGFSGQQGYSGPIMHASEFIGGGLSDYIREHPGYYVSVVCDDLEEPDSPAGWAIAYRPLPEV